MLWSSSGIASSDPSREVPEAFTGLNYTKAAYAKSAMVTAANPHAVNAGVEMLKLGGSAIDAAVAIQAVLTLVEPQSSGIGGGAFLLWYDNLTRELSSFDGRETAPKEATPSLFLDESGKPLKWIDAVVGGKSVGTPGVLHMLNEVHKKHGKLPWNKLFEPAIALAENGFAVSPRLAKLVQFKFNPGLEFSQTAKDYFFPNGKPLQEGQLLVNKPLAAAYKKIANQGVSAFYQGDIAKNIVNTVQNLNDKPGLLSETDLAEYKSKQREAVCIDYKADDNQKYEVCSMGPPSSGGLTVLQILALLEPFKLSDKDYDGADVVHLYTQAAKLAFADRNRYLADSDFVSVPVEGFLNKSYIAKRHKLIQPRQDLGKAMPGKLSVRANASNESIEQPNTSHLSIIDRFGNAISMTTSIEMGFGSTLMSDGFLLNNQLTDFSLIPERNGKPIANRVEGGKRPRSSMTPVMVFKNGELYAVLGSPGGSRIINYVGYALVGLLDFGLDMETVINAPRVSNRNGFTSLEKNTSLVSIKSELEKRGHKVRMVEMTSGIHGILKVKKGYQGSADPRREGTAVGL